MPRTSHTKSRYSTPLYGRKPMGAVSALTDDELHRPTSYQPRSIITSDRRSSYKNANHTCGSPPTPAPTWRKRHPTLVANSADFFDLTVQDRNRPVIGQTRGCPITGGREYPPRRQSAAGCAECFRRLLVSGQAWRQGAWTRSPARIAKARQTVQGTATRS